MGSSSESVESVIKQQMEGLEVKVSRLRRNESDAKHSLFLAQQELQAAERELNALKVCMKTLKDHNVVRSQNGKQIGELVED